MLANNVRETTVTIGTGDITLAGATENGRSFSSQFGVNERFVYFIDDRTGNWESGVGYLSNATTMVRESPLDGSASVPLNFGAGTKQVFLSVSANSNPSSYPYRPDTTVANPDRIYVPQNMANTGSSVTLTPDRIYYIPITMDYGREFDGLGYRGNTGISGTLLTGVYSIGANGLPANIIEKVSIDTSSGGLSLASISSRAIPSGDYWFAVWCDAAASVRAANWIYNIPKPYTGFNFELRNNGALIIDGQTGLTELADVAVTPTGTLAGNTLCPVLRYT